MREENLFYRLTSNDEDSVTELLCNLCKFDVYKNLIFSTLNINNEGFSYYDMETQYKIPKKAKRPDIVIENLNMKIFVENKVTKYRKIELSQLTIYPDHLQKIKNIENKKIMLIFLIPKGYKYLDKIEAAKKKYTFISIVYWDTLLENIKLKNKHLKSEILDESLKYFEKILNSIPEIIFTLEEIKAMTNLNQMFTETVKMGKIFELFDNIIGQLKDNLSLKYKRGEEPRKEISEYGLGYYFYQDNCFLGYSFGLIGDKSTEKYVLSFAIHKNIVSDMKIKKLVDKSFYFDEEWYYFKINKNWLENEKKENELLLFCEKTMKDIVKKVK
jgi:hypothetical protein